MNKKILIFGSGVIGSIMGTLFSNHNLDVSLYARGGRLVELHEKGLLYYDGKKIKKTHVHIVSNLESLNQHYDFVFVTVRYEQMESALEQVKHIHSNNIVTMVNNPNGYKRWEQIVGKGKIIPAFPGAGGKIKNGVLDYSITPRFIQSTIFGELNGRKTERIKVLEQLFTKTGIPYSISNHMDSWQKSHLALVLPLANGIYKDGGDNFTTSKNKDALKYMALTLKRNFLALKVKGIKVHPKRFTLFIHIPNPIIMFVLKQLYKTKLAGTVISEHALSAKGEMMELEKGFNAVLQKSNTL